MTPQALPTLQDVIKAQKHVYQHLKPTPLYHYGGLSQLLGAEIWVKHENHQPVGAFKIRGGLNLAASLSDEQQKAGLFTASTGNHGQSIAYAGQLKGVPTTIAMPEGANPGKVAAIRSFGAEVAFVGQDFDEAREWAAERARQTGALFVGPADFPLIVGVATYALEILQDLPNVDTIIVPVGGGSGAAGVCTVAKAINPAIEVIAVQSAQAPAAQLSWKAGAPVEADMRTFAEGVATRVPFELPQRILRQHLDDFVLVDDEDLKAAIVLHLEHTHNLVEGAGASSLAAALQLKDRLAGKKVALVLSGGNLGLEKLKGILDRRGADTSGLAEKAFSESASISESVIPYLMEETMTTQNPHLATDQQMVGDIYTSAEVMDNLSVLCDDFGSRFGGTEGERQAAEFIKAKLEEYGLSNVHLEPIDYLGWVRGKVTLEIISPIQKTIPCITLPHSPPTTLEGVIVDMGDGAPEDFELRADEIKGNIVMTTSVVNPNNSKRWIHRNEKLGRSIFAGAAGFIFVNHYPGYGPATGGIGHNNKAALIPGISITKEDGDFIRRLAKRKGTVKIRLTSSDQLQPMTSWNIIGDLPGRQKPDQIVMLGSHYDGHDISQGAGDPASGAVSVMEAARVLAKYAPSLPCTVRFALWGIEEIGLLGSKAYAQTHADELSNIRLYLNMDSAGVIAPKDIVLHEWPSLQAHFEGYQEEMTLEFAVGQSVHDHSDHYPFFEAGAPTGGIETVRDSLSGRGYGHTMYDTVDKVSMVGLREAAALGSRLALRIANEEDWPAARRDASVVQELLNRPDQREYKEFNDKLDEFYGGKKK